MMEPSNLVADRDEVTWRIAEIGPTDAAQLLANSISSHPPKQALVRSYARDMAAGVWKLNGQPIIIGANGKLLDGRARLTACVQAKATFRTLVIENIDPSHFETIDSVRRRTFADILTIRKEPAGRALASSLTFVWRYYNGTLERTSAGMSAQQMLDVLRARPELRSSLEFTRPLSKIIPPGMATALHHLMARVDSAKADEFFAGVADRTRSDEGDPAALLRKTIERLKADGGALSQPHLAAITIKAWNAYFAGEKRLLLRWRSDGERPEQFPVIEGLPDDDGSDIASAITAQALASETTEERIEAEAKELIVYVGTVTPSKAQELLARNDGNRGMAAAVVEKYRRDIEAGNWALNGQTIKVGRSGRLLDGQHRCMAAMEAGQSFPGIIVYGVDDEAFDTLDLGAKRSLAALLERRGEKNTTSLAAAAKLLWLYQRGRIQEKNATPTAKELLDVIDQNTGLKDSMRQVLQKTRDVVSPSIAVCFHYIFSQNDRSLADEFFDRLGDGANLDQGSPVLILRNRLLKDRSDKRRSIADSERIALVIKAWNAFKAGESISQLKWQNAGPRKERMPEIA